MFACVLLGERVLYCVLKILFILTRVDFPQNLNIYWLLNVNLPKSVTRSHTSAPFIHIYFCHWMFWNSIRPKHIRTNQMNGKCVFETDIVTEKLRISLTFESEEIVRSLAKKSTSIILAQPFEPFRWRSILSSTMWINFIVERVHIGTLAFRIDTVRCGYNVQMSNSVQLI